MIGLIQPELGTVGCVLSVQLQVNHRDRAADVKLTGIAWMTSIDFSRVSPCQKTDPTGWCELKDRARWSVEACIWGAILFRQLKFNTSLRFVNVNQSK
jgi:hypothetical protein